MLAVIIHKKYNIYSVLQKTNISLTGNHIFCRFECQNNAVGSDRALSLYWKEVHFETGFSLAVFSKTTKAEFTKRGSRSMVQNVLRARANVGSVVSGNNLLFNWLGFCSRYSSIRCQRASVPRTRPAGVKTSPEKPREEGASDKGSRQDAQVQVILLPGPLLHACEVSHLG